MKYLVTPAPHKYARMSTNDMYVYISIALVMCLVYGAVNYRLSTLVVLATCFVPCVALELIISCIKNRKFMLQDASCFVTGLTLTCVMPANLPWYLGILAAVITVGLKYLFGGLGNNIFNPSALGRGILGCLFTSMSFDLFGSSGTVLQTLLSGNANTLVMQDLLLGSVSGAVGTGCILMILICAVVGFVVMVWLSMGASSILPMLMSGSFLFVSVFMLSDPTTSPYGFSARSIYSLIFGVLAAVMMRFNVLGETAVFLALLVANFVAPALDRVFAAFKKGVKAND